MLDLHNDDFSFDMGDGTGRRSIRSGDRLKHLAWIIPLCVFGLIVALCVDYALQSKDRERYSAETYMQELEGRVLRAMTWSTYVPNPERDETLPSNDPLLRLIAPEIEAELRAMEIPKTKPGKGQPQPEGDAMDQSGPGAVAFEFFRFAEQVAAERAAQASSEPAGAETGQQTPAAEPAEPVVRRGGAGGGSTFGAGSGCQLVEGVRRC